MDRFSVSRVEDKEAWEQLNLSCSEKTFMQSWSSKEWREAMGQKVDLWGVFSGRELLGGALVAKLPVIKKGGFGISFYFLPHGPLVRADRQSDKERIMKDLMEHLQKKARADRGVAFIRLAPAWPNDSSAMNILGKLGFQPAPMFITPEVTWELDITLPEEDILAGMRKTTRYLIKKGLANDELVCQVGSEPADLEVFLDLYRQTVGRHAFQAFTLDYLRKEMEFLGQENQLSVLSAHYRGQPLAAAMIVFYDKTAYYHQGASANVQPKDAPASYLIQWKAIQEARKRGCQRYNFWGIADRDDPRHAYHGLSLFKKGFGGERLEYVPTHDRVIRWTYHPNYLLEKIRRKKRNL